MPLIRFVVDLLLSPQHLDMSRCWGFIVDLSKVEKLWICCGFVVDLLSNLMYTTNPQQIEQVEFELKAIAGSNFYRNFVVTVREACLVG
jgi:hypothetical protein